MNPLSLNSVVFEHTPPRHNQTVQPRCVSSSERTFCAVPIYVPGQTVRNGFVSETGPPCRCSTKGKKKEKRHSRERGFGNRPAKMAAATGVDERRLDARSRGNNMAETMFTSLAEREARGGQRDASARLAPPLIEADGNR